MEVVRSLAALAEEAETVATSVGPAAKGGFQGHRRDVRNALAAAGIAKQLDEAVTELLNLKR